MFNLVECQLEKLILQMCQIYKSWQAGQTPKDTTIYSK